MGASSVTGVSGVGSAEGSMRGPGNGRNQFVSLVSPHVITAETITLSGSTTTVTFSNPLPSPAGLTVSHTYTAATTPVAGYVVTYGNSTAIRTPWTTSWHTDANGNWDSFVITGTSGDVISYVVTSVGRPPAAPLL